MSVGVPLDGDLAWAVQSWNGSQQGTLTHEQIESLTRHLTAVGFVRPRADLSLTDVQSVLKKAQKSIGDLLDNTLKGTRDEAQPAH